MHVYSTHWWVYLLSPLTLTLSIVGTTSVENSPALGLWWHTMAFLKYLDNAYHNIESRSYFTRWMNEVIKFKSRSMHYCKSGKFHCQKFFCHWVHIDKNKNDELFLTTYRYAYKLWVVQMLCQKIFINDASNWWNFFALKFYKRKFSMTNFSWFTVFSLVTVRR